MSVQGKHYLPQRIAHLINLIGMSLLTLTGFYISYPFAKGMMGVARYLHYVFAFIVILNVAWRVYYAFLGKHKDYFEFKLELGKILPVFKYYFFVGDQVVSKGKYNPLQKLVYLSIPILILCQGSTGFALANPEGTLDWFVKALGGLANVRALHYLGTWVFICFTLLHVYVILLESPKQLGAMFLGKETDKQVPLVNPAGLNVRQR